MESAAPASAPAASSPSPSTSSAPASSPGTQSATPAPAQGATAATLPGDQQAQSATPEPRFYTQKINGQSRQVPAEALDAAAAALGIDPQDLLQGTQLKAAAYQRFEEARKLKAEIEKAQAEQAKRYEDPRVKQVMAERGLSREDAAALVRIQEIIQAEQMSPEQRAALEERQKREAAEAKLREYEEGQKQARAQAETQAHVQRFHAEIPQAMEEAGLPRDPAAARLVIEHAQRAAQFGIPIDLKWAARDAMQQMTERYAPIFAKLPPERLVSMLGKDAIAGLQRHLIAQTQQPPAPTPKPPTEQPPQRKAYGETPDEWRRRIYG